MLMKTFLCALFVCLFSSLSACAGVTSTADDPKEVQDVSPPQSATAPSTATAVHGITQAAVSAGVLTSASRINQLANFLTDGSSNVGALLFIPPDHPDQKLVSFSLELPATHTVPVAYASASVAPNQANGIGGMYESILYWNQSCEIVATRNFGNLKKIGSLDKSIMVLDGGILTKVFLMPAGDGCVAIKKELVF